MGPLIISTLVWLGYEYGKTRKTGSLIFRARKESIDTSLSLFQKGEVKNALMNQTDPEALHVMALSLQATAPIASKALQEKSDALKAIAEGKPTSYKMPDFDYS